MLTADPRNPIRLGVNIDHVATLRQARRTSYPDPVQAAAIVQDAGADGLTIHLREDRRHIQDHDVTRLKRMLQIPMNLEMAATEEMCGIATQIRPAECCLVPERRQELTTEGGLDAAANVSYLTEFCARLADADVAVSLFIDPESSQIDAAHAVGAPIVELHTGQYAEVQNNADHSRELRRLAEAVQRGLDRGLQVNAGHGLRYDNVQDIAAMEGISCLNIGHSIIARAVMMGLKEAVGEMKRLMSAARASAINQRSPS